VLGVGLVRSLPNPRLMPHPLASPQTKTETQELDGLFANLQHQRGDRVPQTLPEPPFSRPGLPVILGRRSWVSARPRTLNLTCASGIVALTYASHHGRDERFCRSLESAVRNDLDLHVLGWGLKWEGLSQKLAAALAAVEDLPADCPVLFTDAYDVLFTESGQAMRRKFEEHFSHPLIFSAECGCWPQVQRDRGVTCRDRYPRSPTPYRYLNSGSWIGRASVAARFLRAIVKGARTTGAAFHKLNDQELSSELYLRREFGPELALDHGAILFQAMHAVKDNTAVPDCDPWPELRETDGIWQNTLTGSRPSVYHYNGGGKRHHIAMESKMWWKQCAEANEPAAHDAVRKTTMRFGDRERSFDEICPGHLDQYRNRQGERVCGDDLISKVAQRHSQHVSV